jgi:hypothetical protein
MNKKFKNTVITQNNTAQKTTPSRTTRRGILPLTAENNKERNTFYCGTTKSRILLTAEKKSGILLTVEQQQRAEHFLPRNNQELNTSYCKTTKRGKPPTEEQKSENKYILGYSFSNHTIPCVANIESDSERREPKERWCKRSKNARNLMLLSPAWYLEGVVEPLLLPLPVSDHFLRAVGMKFRP